MTQEQVENIIGPASEYRNEGVIGGDTNALIGSYRTPVPGHPGKQLMTVHYDKTDAGFILREVRGPHFPD